MLRDFAVLVVRATVGGLLAGHGAQKLFGWFGGGGLEGTGGFLEGLGFRPGRRWAGLAAVSELGGGLLTVLGFLNPVGPLAAMGAMLVATMSAHAGKPIWVTEGGAELPVTNMAVLGAVSIGGPGRFSLDRLLGTRLPRWTAIPGALLVGAATWLALAQRERTRSSLASSGAASTPPPADVEVPRRLEVAGDAGAGAADEPVGPEPPAGDAVAQPFGDDAIAAATRAAPDVP